MAIYYVTNKKPRSHNQGGSREDYKKSFGEEFNKKYAKLYKDSSLPLVDCTLQTRVTYIHQLRPGVVPDVDNLSKPIVDAFSGVIYKDDRQVIKRTAVIIGLEDFASIEIDATDMPKKIYDDFMEYINNKEESIVLYQVDKIEIGDIKIGEI